MSTPRIDQEALDAWLDGELEGDQARVIEALVRGDTEEAAYARAVAQQETLLHRAFDGVLAEPVPARLARRRLPLSRVGRVAATVLLFVAGGVLGWWLRGEMGHGSVTPLPRVAAIAHAVYTPEVRHPVEVTAREEAHLVGWLSKRLGATVRAPKLTGVGFELLGGRLMPETGRPGAQFMYQDASGRRLTLYVSTDIDNRDTAFRYAQENGLHVFYWIDRQLGYALAGELDKADMLQVARAVYEQLNP